MRTEMEFKGKKEKEKKEDELLEVDKKGDKDFD
jgi:hypothetical protein